MTISQEKIDLIKTYGEAGFTYTEIAKETQISMKTIRKILGPKKHDKHHMKIGADEKERMLRLREQGLSNSQIAIELGCSDTTVRRFLKKQPLGNRAEYGSIISHATGETYVKEEKPAMPNKRLKILKTEVTMEGQLASYRLSSEGHVRITFSTGTQIDLEKDDFLTLITELCEAGEWLSNNQKDEKPRYRQRLDGTYVSQ